MEHDAPKKPRASRNTSTMQKLKEALSLTAVLKSDLPAKKTAPMQKASQKTSLTQKAKPASKTSSSQKAQPASKTPAGQKSLTSRKSAPTLRAQAASKTSSSQKTQSAPKTPVGQKGLSTRKTSSTQKAQPALKTSSAKKTQSASKAPTAQKSLTTRKTSSTQKAQPALKTSSSKKAQSASKAPTVQKSLTTRKTSSTQQAQPAPKTSSSKKTQSASKAPAGQKSLTTRKTSSTQKTKPMPKTSPSKKTQSASKTSADQKSLSTRKTSSTQKAQSVPKTSSSKKTQSASKTSADQKNLTTRKTSSTQKAQSASKTSSPQKNQSASKTTPARTVARTAQKTSSVSKPQSGRKLSGTTKLPLTRNSSPSMSRSLAAQKSGSAQKTQRASTARTPQKSPASRSPRAASKTRTAKKAQSDQSSGGSLQPHPAPMTERDAVQPHLRDTAPFDLDIKPMPKPTPPGMEPMAAGTMKTPQNVSVKSKSLDAHRSEGENRALTTNLGVKIANNQNTLKAGNRGPSLLEDFIMREKMQHFDHERIPERVVHARASGAHGFFQVYESLEKYTKAAFLCDPQARTPVFVRLSTVQGFRGSPDTVRDIRGFATKFYTSEGNYDLVGNDTAVFFIQDAMKFPDFVHAVKPEPHNEVPQGQSAHDSLWDFVSLQPESLHNIMWAMSDRGIPRSLRMIQGFGIHTFRLVNAEGRSHFVRFHWRPLAGTCSLIWDEANLIMGRDPDFHRKDLWEAIEAGDYPQWELGLQIIAEEDEHKFDFDILDPTKLIPEALVPLKIVGKMTLNRNPDNFFAETEQVAFCPANIVPGIDFSDDPLLQGRIFSYVDTHEHRLGGPNFHEIPINRPVCPFANHQRDGRHRMQIDRGANYEPNSISNNWPREVPAAAHDGGFESYHERIEAHKVRERSESFLDYYSQPRLFWLSQTPVEQQHIINAFSFELGKVARPYIRERVVDLLTRVDRELAGGVAKNLSIVLTRQQLSRDLPGPVNGLEKDEALSMYANKTFPVASRKVALLVADGVCGTSVGKIQKALSAKGVHSQLLAPRSGFVKSREGENLKVDGTIEGTASVLFDAVIVPTGNENIQMLSDNGAARHYLMQAFKHLKVIGVQGDAKKVFQATGLEETGDEGVVMSDDLRNLTGEFLNALSQHRIWAREGKTGNVAA